MLTDLESGLGLDIVIWIQSYNSPFLDFIALALHVLGSTPAYIVVGLLLFWRLDRRFTAQWIFAIVVTSIVTDLLKLTIAAPRPFQVAPELVRALVIQADSHGLPSGHVSHFLVVFGLFAVWFKRWWLWAATVIATLLMAWARMYLGVHYPQDVIAGVLVGMFCLWFSVRYFDSFMMLWRRFPPLLRYATAVIVIILIILL
jgi:membrane-associated phospholipid phosphatase